MLESCKLQEQLEMHTDTLMKLKSNHAASSAQQYCPNCKNCFFEFFYTNIFLGSIVSDRPLEISCKYDK